MNLASEKKSFKFASILSWHTTVFLVYLCSTSSWSSKSAMNSWVQNCQKSPNFEISEGARITTRVPREVIMVTTFHSERARLVMSFNVFILNFVDTIH